MKDGAGQNICRHDLVMLNNKSRTAHHHHRDGESAMVLRSVPGRKVVVQCVDGTEATEYASDVTDRSFLHPGHVVLLASDGGGQVGVVTGATTVLDLLSDNGADDVASSVSPAEVQRVSELCLGDYVVAAGSSSWPSTSTCSSMAVPLCAGLAGQQQADHRHRGQGLPEPPHQQLLVPGPARRGWCRRQLQGFPVAQVILETLPFAGHHLQGPDCHCARPLDCLIIIRAATAGATAS